LHTFILPILLLICLSLCEVLELVVSFPTSPSSLKTEFVCIFYCIFGFGGFTDSFLREVLTSPYLVFYLLLILGLYVVHWIYLSLSFSESPSLLKSESGRKSYHRFRLLSFSVGANPVLTGIFTGRLTQGRRDRAVHWGGRRAPGFHRKPYLGGFFGAGPVLTGLCTGRSDAEPGETDF
jgi:hypothetical protein